MAKEQRRKRRKFSDEYKAETVRLIQSSGKSVGQMALELGIGESALRRWCAQAEVEAGRGPEGALTRSERAELVELRRENRRLQMEREILKNYRIPRAASPARRETLQTITISAGLGAMAVRFLVTREPVKKHGLGVDRVLDSGDVNTAIPVRKVML